MKKKANSKAEVRKKVNSQKQKGGIFRKELSKMDENNFEEVKSAVGDGSSNNQINSDDDNNEVEDYHSLVREQNRKHKKSGGFLSMGLNPNVFKGITKKGYKQPTPIQRKCIPLLLEGRDCVAMARTGSGKTAAFLVPMFQRLRARSAMAGVRALILSPTRELALQTLKFTKELGRFVGLQAVVILGGEKIEDQFAAIHTNPDVILATPGRFLHVTLEMNLNLNSVEYIVFDEADRLFELGFADQMRQILDRLPNDSRRQTLLFSATLPKMLVDFAKAGLKDPTLIRLDVETKLSENLQTSFLYVRQEDKVALLLHFLRQVVAADAQTLVFVATKHHVEFLREILTLAGFEVAFCYSALDQVARKIEVAKFRLKKAKVMIVTDVAARGIDIPLLDNVINFHFPAKAKVFVHRVGRVARAGATGTAYSLVSSDEFAHLLDLHLFLGRTLTFAQPNSASDEDGLVGGVPQSILDREGDSLNRFVTDSAEVSNLVKVTTNAYKMYIKSRPVASTESSKRLKLMNLASSTIAPHPCLVSDGDAAEPLQQLLSDMKSFRPQATIFEINKSKQTEAVAVMKQKRQTHDEIVVKKRRKLETDGNANVNMSHVETVDGTEVSFDEASGADIADTFGANIIAPKNRTDAFFKKIEAKKSRKNEAKSFKDDQFYVPSLAKDFHSERGLEVSSSNSFEFEAKGVTMDLTGDDDDAMRRQRDLLKRKRWDRKKMKFVGVNEKQVKAGKKIKNESGQWITASYKTDRYAKWKKVSKAEALNREEGEDGEIDSPKSRAPPNVNPAMGFRRKWHSKNDAAKANLGDGLKSKENILKTRLKKDAKKSYQLYREKMNKKKRNR